VKYQQATKSAQKEQPKIPSSSLADQTSFNRISTHPLLRLQRTIGNQAVQNMLHPRSMPIDATMQAFRESGLEHDFGRIPGSGKLGNGVVDWSRNSLKGGNSYGNNNSVLPILW
jgi:hypothetical protein